MTGTISNEEKIKGAYASLRASEKKVADYVLDRLNDVGHLSIAELSAGAKVSQPMVIRFVRALGFGGYREFKYALLREKRGGAAEKAFEPLGGFDLRPWDTLEDIPLKTIRVSKNVLDDTLKSVSPAAYQKAVALLAGARIIDIYCVENFITPASDLLNKLTYLGLQCRINTDSYLQQIAAGHLSAEDAPGPLTTTDTVKREMMFDHCTWDDDYKKITREIRSRLLELAGLTPDRYTVVLMQGSGTFGVESVFSSVIDGKVLICSNGAYGDRMAEICRWNRIPFAIYREPCDRIPSAETVARLLDEDPAITHVAIVHCETTTGILNDIQSVGAAVKARGRTFIVDAMSSFGCIEIPVEKWGIDFLISSANKCIQGVPGFSFIIARREPLIRSKETGRNLSLNLFGQWETMERDGKWRFTSPTHAVLAFSKALGELRLEGGIPARGKRYAENNRLLIEGMAKLGFRPYIEAEHQSPVITTFLYPQGVGFRFDDMYRYIKDRGYAIYPGKLTEVDTFRIGNIGEIYPGDIRKVCGIIKDFLQTGKEEIR